MDAKEFQTEMQVWARRLSIQSSGNTAELLKKICKNERKELWQRIILSIRPSYEVEHMKKNLALKKASIKMKLRKQLEEKEETANIMEHDYEQISQRLRLLNCKVQATKQSTKELGMRTMLLSCKKQDMERKAMMYKQLSQVTDFVKQPSSFGSSVPSSSQDKQLETFCQNVINKAEIQISELHRSYRTSDVNLQVIRTKKESVVQFIRDNMKNIPITIVWYTMLNMMNKLNAEVRDLIQSNIGNKPQQMLLLEEKADVELQKFMIIYLELLKPYCQLQQRVAACKTEYNELLDKAVQLLQEKLYLVKLTEDGEELAEIRTMLELETRIAELQVMKKIFENEIMNMKIKQSPPVLDVDEEEINKLDTNIGQLETNIKTNYVWLKKSYSNHSKAHKCLQESLARLPKMCSFNNCGVNNLDAAMKVLQTAFQQEFKEFMELPFNAFDNLVLPSGVTVPRSQQMLKYNLNLAEMADSNDLPTILTILNCAPSASPHTVVLQTLENKLYLNALTSVGFNSSVINISSDNMNLTSMQQTEHVANALISDIIESLKTSITRCKTVADRAENNYRSWVEHPLQHAVPEKLRLHEKSFRQWQGCYNNMLASVGDLEVGVDFNINVQ